LFFSFFSPRFFFGHFSFSNRVSFPLISVPLFPTTFSRLLASERGLYFFPLERPWHHQYFPPAKFKPVCTLFCSVLNTGLPPQSQGDEEYKTFMLVHARYGDPPFSSAAGGASTDVVAPPFPGPPLLHHSVCESCPSREAETSSLSATWPLFVILISTLLFPTNTCWVFGCFLFSISFY